MAAEKKVVAAAELAQRKNFATVAKLIPKEIYKDELALDDREQTGGFRKIQKRERTEGMEATLAAQRLSAVRKQRAAAATAAAETKVAALVEQQKDDKLLVELKERPVSECYDLIWEKVGPALSDLEDEHDRLSVLGMGRGAQRNNRLRLAKEGLGKSMGPRFGRPPPGYRPGAAATKELGVHGPQVDVELSREALPGPLQVHKHDTACAAYAPTLYHTGTYMPGPIYTHTC